MGCTATNAQVVTRCERRIVVLVFFEIPAYSYAFIISLLDAIIGSVYITA